MKKRITRREFLRGTAIAGAALPWLAHSRGIAQAASGKLRHAAVGVNGKGKSNLANIAGSGKVDVVALCDIDANSLNEAAATFPDARKYRDWRELLDKEQDHIDSVSVSTPDHMHAPVTLSAIRLGKHVFCEKPLTHSVHEARQVTLAAREAGIVSQMGIQIHSHTCYRTAVQVIQDGALGKVKEWHSWISNSYSAPDAKRPEGEDSIPAHVDWDLWLGVAPARPYKADVYHPGRWRHWRDFGSGGFGDFGCHIFDPVFTALGLDAPRSVRADAPKFDPEVWPSWEVVHYEFPGTELTAADTLKATWYDGGKKPPADLVALPNGQTLPESGSVIVGEKGTMVLPHYKRLQLLPVDKFREYTMPKVSGKNHYAEWVNACLGNGAASAPFDYSGPLTETVLLGNIATCFAGKTLEWDSANLAFTSMPEANAMLRRTYREGWHIEGLG
jgi:predicted dehydrogenase